MKKYFICSDIHSFYDSFMEALQDKEFDRNNQNHILVILGDVFDRGEDTVPLYDYLMSLNQKRLILIKGNHEDLYLELLEKEYPESFDFSNGTVKTFCHISNIPFAYETIESGYYADLYNPSSILVDEGIEMWTRIQEKVKKSPITKWIKSKKWKNYIEIGDYICTHSFIPLDIKDMFKERANIFLKKCGEYKFNLPIEYFKYYEDWRIKANSLDWFNARWGCPFDLYDKGFFQKETNKGKKLVFGHWHCSEGHKRYENMRDDYSIYQNKDIIAIDACTVISKKTNIFIIEG